MRRSQPFLQSPVLRYSNRRGNTGGKDTRADVSEVLKDMHHTNHRTCSKLSGYTSRPVEQHSGQKYKPKLIYVLAPEVSSQRSMSELRGKDAAGVRNIRDVPAEPTCSCTNGPTDRRTRRAAICSRVPNLVKGSTGFQSSARNIDQVSPTK